MKLRIKGNTLRLRVTRSELARLSTGEHVEEVIHFAPEPSAALRYILASSPETDRVGVRYQPGELRVLLAPDQIRLWSEENQVGIYTALDLGYAGAPEVSIEKDFACLDRSEEDNSDTFANPHMGQAC